MFIRNESFYSFRKNYPVVFSLVIIHMILFAWINLTSLTNGLIPFGDLIFQLGVGFNAAIAAGEWWRLFTPVFLHQGLTHVILNSFALVLFAPPLEQMLGRAKFILVYVLMGLLANVATFYLGGLYYSHLGASGAVFGVFGIYMYLIWKRKDLIDAASAQLILILTLFSVVMTFLSPNINVYAHIFGLFSGFLLAPFFLRNATPFFSVQHSKAPPEEPVFNPNRWKGRRRFRAPIGQRLPRLIGYVFVVLIVIGLLARAAEFLF